MAKINIQNGIISSSADYALYHGTTKVADVKQDEIRVQGDLIAENYIVSSSVVYATSSFASGSTIFGNSADDKHRFTGSIHVSSSRGTVNNLGPGDFYFNTDSNSTFKIFDAGTNAIGLYAASGDEIYFGANNTFQMQFIADGTKINLNDGVSISGSVSSTGSFGSVHVADKVGIGQLLQQAMLY